MNLETFKARARRKLELPHRSTQQSAAPAKQVETPPIETEQKPATMTPLEPGVAGQNQSPDSSIDKFAQALTQAHQLEVAKSATSESTATSATETTAAGQRVTSEDLRVDRRASGTEPPSLQSVTGSPSQRSGASEDNDRDSDNEAELVHLRSLLLGSNHKTQHEQVEVIYQRTQASVNGLRRDIDARLDDLTEYVGQLEQSILNSAEAHAEALREQTLKPQAEEAEQRLQEHNDRLDALDVRLSNTLTNLRAEFEADRESDRTFLRNELANANARTDRLLVGVTTRLDASIQSIEQRLTTQLASQSEGLVAESETTVNNLREQLGNLIDERVRTFNDQQAAGLVELRDTLLANTKEINASLQRQTEQQQSTLQTHRVELEKQFNAAITVLTQSKVSHKELSQLLSRLADRIKLSN